jgi:tetratricopeptide (TPR) repeat protein
MTDESTLFDVPLEKLVGVTRSMIDQDIDKAKQEIQSLSDMYPYHPNIERERQVVFHIHEALNSDGTPADYFKRFRAYKKLLQQLAYAPTYAIQVEELFFQHVIEAFGGDPPQPVYGFPAGFLFMKAGMFEEARESLEGEASPPSLASRIRARLIGYLGDLYSMMGDEPQAREKYLEALLIDWRGMDAENIVDEDVKALVSGSYVPEGHGGIWAASVGAMLLILPRPDFKDSDDVLSFSREFIALKTAHKKEESEELAGKLFYCALVIAENEQLFRSLKDADSMELRKLMRKLNASLFRLYNKINLSSPRDAEDES